MGRQPDAAECSAAVLCSVTLPTPCPLLNRCSCCLLSPPGRAALPTGVIANAIATVGGLAPFIPELLQHHHRHCMPLLVGMLQVELLTARLPPPKQRPLEVLGRLLQHG